jgi:hypothetical protein
MSEENSNPASQSDSPRKQGVNSISPVYLFIGVVIIGLLFVLYLRYGDKLNVSRTPSSEAITIGFVDIDKIIYAGTRRFIESNKDMDKNPNVSGNEFSNKLKAALDEYKKSGIIVLDGKYVLTAPEGTDFTKSVAAKLGLELEKK